MTINQNLRQLRIDTGMTQEQVASIVGVTRQALSSYESGRTRPDIDMLLSLAKVYGTDLDGILYGETRKLKAARTVRIMAIALFCTIIILTALSSAFLWSANRFYPMPIDQLTQEGMAIFEARQRLTGAWETTDTIILTVSLIGFLLLVILNAAQRCRIPWRTKLLFCGSFLAAMLGIPLLFGSTDAVFTTVDYLITPMLVSARLTLFLAIHFVIDLFQRRRERQRTE